MQCYFIFVTFTTMRCIKLQPNHRQINLLDYCDCTNKACVKIVRVHVFTIFCRSRAYCNLAITQLYLICVSLFMNAKD